MIGLLRRNPDFRKVLLAQLISYMGDWFATVALIGLLLDLTGSDLMATLVLVAQMLPGFVLSALSGPVADRYDRRRLMVGISVAQTLAALAFLAVGPSTVWVAFAAQAGVAALAAFFGPASQAALPNLVDPKDLPDAVSLISSTWGAMLAIGAALGGVFTLAFGRQAAFVADALTFAVAAALVASVRRPMRAPDAPPPEGRVRPIADTREAVGYAWRHREVLALLASKMGFGLSAGLVGMLPIFATRRFHAGDAGIGVLLGARGAGVVLGPLIARRFAGLDLGGVLRACGLAALTHACFYALVPAAPVVWVAAALVLAGHLGGGTQWTLSTYGLQVLTPDALRGRVFAGDYALVTLTMSVSYLAAGAASTRFGPGPVTLVLACVGATWGSVYLASTRAMRRRLTTASTAGIDRDPPALRPPGAASEIRSTSVRQDGEGERHAAGALGHREGGLGPGDDDELDGRPGRA